MSRKLFIFFGLILGVMLLWPADAYAWGPAVHTHLALQTLVQVGALAQALRHLLKRYPHDFLYGNLSADIILGKRYIDYYYHCHNWRVGLEVLEHAKNDAQRAFAYGYLCHLAADVVAHNLFVPDKLVRSYHTLTTRHTYWEIRYDVRMDPQLIQQAHRVAEVFHEPNDRLLEEVLRETLFSFSTNKKIFNGLLLVQKHERVQKFLQRVAARSPLSLEDELARHYEALSQETVMQFLRFFTKSEPMIADPAGHDKLDIAGDLRGKLKKLEKRGHLDEKDIKRVIERFHQLLRDTLFLPEKCPNADQIIDASF